MTELNNLPDVIGRYHRGGEDDEIVVLVSLDPPMIQEYEMTDADRLLERTEDFYQSVWTAWYEAVALGWEFRSLKDWADDTYPDRDSRYRYFVESDHDSTVDKIRELWDLEEDVLIFPRPRQEPVIVLSDDEWLPGKKREWAAEIREAWKNQKQAWADEAEEGYDVDDLRKKWGKA